MKNYLTSTAYILKICILCSYICTHLTIQATPIHAATRQAAQAQAQETEEIALLRRVIVDYSFAATYTQKIYDAQTELDGIAITDVNQSSDGYMWLATYGGLFRFDGKNFLKITAAFDPDFRDGPVRLLFRDAQDRLYVGTLGGGLYIYENGGFRTIPLANSENPSFGLLSMAQDKAGTIYASTTRGMAYLYDGALILLNDSRLDNVLLTQMAFDKHNRLWAISNDYRFFIVQDAKVIFVGDFGHMKDKPFPTALTAYGEGILVGTDRDVLAEVTFTDKLNIVRIHSLASQVSDIKNFYNDGEKLWALGNTGIGYVTSDKRFMAVKDLQVQYNLERMIKDRAGNYWLASSRQGLLLLGKSVFHTEFHATVHGNVLFNAPIKWNDTLYVATNTGLLAKDDDILVSNPLTDFMAGKAVRNVLVDSHDNLWLTSDMNNASLVKVTPDFDIQTFTMADGLVSGRILSLLERDNGELWVGSFHGISIIKKNGRIENITSKNGLIDPAILTMMEDAQGRVLAASGGGLLYSITDNKAYKLTQLSPHDGKVVFRLRHDPHTQQSFLTTGTNSLEVITEEKSIPIKDFRLEGNLLDLLFYQDKIIIISSAGIYVAKTEEFLQNGTKYTFFDRNIPAFGTGTSIQYVDDNGTLFVASNTEVFSLNLLNMNTSTTPVKTIISAIEVDGTTYYQNMDTITLPPSTSRITVHFANLTYTNNARSMVTRELKGFSAIPSTMFLAETSNVSYTSLPGGDYTFVLTGRTADGIATVSPPPLHIKKLAHWYENRLAQGAIALGILLAIMLIMKIFYGIRERRILKRQQEYRAITTQAITAMAGTIDAKDNYTKGHSVRVAKYARAIGEQLGYDELALDTLYYTALLHDIGKIGIPDGILKKSTRLTEEEYNIIRNHPVLGAEILKNITIIDDITLGAKYHHERFGGGGYPNNLSGTDIPLVARIICVADSFDAIASRRSYSGMTSLQWVTEELKKCSGTQFDPEIVEVFLHMLEKNLIDLSELEGLTEE